MLNKLFCFLLAVFFAAACSSKGSGSANIDMYLRGDGSHVALADTTNYKSYIGEDWGTDRKLVIHLVKEMNQGNILAWSTNIEADWHVFFRQGITQESGYREFTGILNNRSGSIYLLNYDSLTMAAQFKDYRLPDTESLEYKTPIPKGLHRVRVVQLTDPEGDTDEKDPELLIEYEPIEKGTNSFSSVPWLDWM